MGCRGGMTGVRAVVGGVGNGSAGSGGHNGFCRNMALISASILAVGDCGGGMLLLLEFAMELLGAGFMRVRV
jgi:hypothetical protein